MAAEKFSGDEQTELHREYVGGANERIYPMRFGVRPISLRS